MTTTDKIPPVHPGEVLMEDFIKGFEITQNKLAVAIGVPPRNPPPPQVSQGLISMASHTTSPVTIDRK